MQKVKEKSNWKGETIVAIEIERLKAFRNHPFQVRDDDDLEKLKESIKMYGILTPHYLSDQSKMVLMKSFPGIEEKELLRFWDIEKYRY